MNQSYFTEYEQRLIRVFAQRFKERNEQLNHTELPIPEGERLEADHALALSLNKLDNFRLIKIVDRASSKPLPLVSEVVKEWDIPPPIVCPEKVNKAIRSNWWSIPMFALREISVAIGGIVLWLIAIEPFLQYLGWTE
jgi:hypothetical protein